MSPLITTKQMLTSQNRDGNNLTCVCARDPSTSPVNDLHPAQLFRVAELLQLIGPSADQFTLKKCTKTYCTSDHTADYNQWVSQRLHLCWNRGDQTWLNPEGFVDHLLLKIRYHLEGADGNEWAASDIALTGPRQTSFLEYIAELPPLHTAYGTVCSDLLQKRQAYEERELQRERRRQQQRNQNQQGNNPSSNGNGQNPGRGSQTQQSDSKVSTITQEEAKKNMASTVWEDRRGYIESKRLRRDDSVNSSFLCLLHR